MEYSFSPSSLGIPLSLSVSEREIIGVIEFIISCVNTRISFCQASISFRSSTEWMFFRLIICCSFPCVTNFVQEIAISKTVLFCSIRIIGISLIAEALRSASGNCEICPKCVTAAWFIHSICPALSVTSTAVSTLFNKFS